MVDFFGCHKGKSFWVGQILLYKTHMQVGNFKWTQISETNFFIFLIFK